jgi:hypothetical protein
MRALLLAIGLATLGVTPLSAQTIAIDTVRADGLVAHLYRPTGASRAAAVILVGGSGGGIGWQDEIAGLLAKRGLVAMAVGYFAMDGLPKELEKIPLEYFDRAIHWLARQPSVDSTRLGIGGVSKGGELALLLASMHPELKAVAVFSPSGVVFQSIAEGYPRTSSWTFGGKEVPFVPYGAVANPATTAEIYLAGIKDVSPDSLEAATIKVERIRGPILMLAGKADNLWASATLAELVAERLRAKRFAYPVESVGYADAGHLISSIRTDDVTRRGGTVDGNAFAQRDGQTRFLEFFARVLGK